MKLSQLRTFLAVVETGSIHGGARLLGVTQPAVSSAIGGLEKMLGAKLFRRSSLGIEPTEYGRAFTVRARALVEDMRRAHEEIARMRDGSTGSVILSLSSTSARVFLPSAFARFRETMPNVSVELNDATWAESIDRLRRGVIDFAMVQGPPGLSYPDSVEVTPLIALPLVIGVRGKNPLVRSRSLGDLSGATWLLPGRPAPGAEVRFAEMFERHGFHPPKLVMRCQSPLTALALLQTMDFVSLFAEPVVRQEFSRYGLKRVPVREPLPHLLHSLLTRRDAPLTTVAAHFFQCLKETCAESVG
ncbi:MAG TPA: LysR family transcriptional regulator [Acidiphilium sp.]